MNAREDNVDILFDPPEIEYLDGVAFPKVSPKYNHAAVQGALVEVLRRLGRGFGTVLPELRCKVGAVDRTKTQFVPDIAFVSRDQRDALTQEERQEPPFAPLIAVEVRSPSDRIGLRNAKVVRYLATGSALVLDVDPKKRTIGAHSTEGSVEFRAGRSRRLNRDRFFPATTFGWGER
jgi:Uma2 family endonuclease